jgi:hypothetical protein
MGTGAAAIEGGAQAEDTAGAELAMVVVAPKARAFSTAVDGRTGAAVAEEDRADGVNEGASARMPAATRAHALVGTVGAAAGGATTATGR